MFQFVLDASLHRRRWLSRTFRLLQRAIASVHDAEVSYVLNGRPLVLPLSHDLPLHRRLFPTYSDNLRRLAAFVRRHHGSLRMIDVGANVGDSWALAAGGVADSFLLVEPDARWFRLLERNTGADPGAIRVRCLLADRAGERVLTTARQGGNARAVEAGANGEAVRIETLDGLVQEHPAFRSVHLIKVDVEGWDSRVLRGAARLLQEAKPVLFFEHDPRQVEALGSHAQEVFRDLAACGYRGFVFYDHRGFLLGRVEAADAARLEELMDYARQQPDFYYDVAAFPDGETEAAERFLAEERSHYASLAPGTAR